MTPSILSADPFAPPADNVLAGGEGAVVVIGLCLAYLALFLFVFLRRPARRQRPVKWEAW